MTNSKLCRTVGALLIVIGLCITFAGCATMYRAIGMTAADANAAAAEDKAHVAALVNSQREAVWQIATAVVTGLGTIATGILAKLLGTERTITKAVILGVEDATGGASVKEAIQNRATTLGVEPVLEKRVQALTG